MNTDWAHDYSGGGASRPHDRYEERLARWESRRHRRAAGTGGWFLGSILILLGAVLLTGNLGLPIGGNWWALIFLVPALGALGAALEITWRRRGFTSSAMGSLTGAVSFTFLSGMFLYDLDWRIWWPMLLVIWGVGGTLSRLLPDDKEEW